MINFIQYDPTTGRIFHNGSCAEKRLSLQIEEGLDTLPLKGSYKTDYVDLTTLTVKPKIAFNLIINKLIITADGIDNIISTNIPVGTELIFDGERYIINDGIMDITLNVAGIYRVILKYPQYITEEFEIEGI